MTGTPRRWRLQLAAALVTAAVLVGVPAGPSHAEPGNSTVTNEGGSKSLRDVLDSASRGFLEAQAALEVSKKRQAELSQQLATAGTRLDELTIQVNEIAAASYRMPRAGAASALLDSASPDTFIDRAATIDALAAQQDRQIRELTQLRSRLGKAKAELDAEVAKQAEQLAVMAKKKQDAEKALLTVGGQATGGHVAASSPVAQPVPRRSDGSFPGESCSVDDPTTSGCLTPRTLHALNQAKAAGFTRFVSCYRPAEDGGEHPRGRACDFAAQTGGFGGDAQGGDRVYGNNLAAYFIRNANTLGVLYVIWFRQIWLPSSGWRAYNGGGDPSSAHTNHVHLSVA